MQKFDDNKNVKTYKDKKILTKLYKYFKPHIITFVISFVLSVIAIVSELVPATLFGKTIGVLASPDLTGPEKIKQVYFYLAIYVGIIIISCIVSYINSIILQRAGQKIMVKLREDVFVHIESLSIAQINKTPVGKLVTRVTSDTNAINELFTSVIVNLLRQILTIIAVTIIMITISPILTLYLFAVVPVLVVVSIIFKRVSRKQYRKVRGCVSNVNAFLSENISGMKITQIFNQEDKKLAEFREKNNELRKNSIRQTVVFGIFRPFIYVLYVVCQIIVLYNGYLLLAAGTLLVDSYVAFYQYIQSFFNPIQQIADQFNRMQQAFASAERIFEVLDTEIEILDDEDAIEIDHIEGKIEFDHVWFAYNDENWILKDVSFTVLPKQTVAFVGATGAGKTTILALIVRNYEIQKGEIRIDGINIKKIKIESLRRLIGQMLQDVFLFSGSIKSNITLKEEAFTEEEIDEACKYVNADKFIDKLDGKLDYQVLERGVNFSSGQRQLLSFARTIIHKPNIMILDEATANIDTETEVLIQDSLEKMMSVGTMLIVAHRLSTVQHADKIIVLHKGQIVEEGTHQQLLSRKGLYYNLYELQYKNKEANKYEANID